MFRKFFAVLALAACATSSHAATILAVADATPDTAFSRSADLNPGAVGVGFTLFTDRSEVSIDAEFGCAGACEVLAFLVREVGPGAGLGDVVASTALDGSTTSIFTGLSLVADQYALILSTSTGAFAWAGSTTPSVTEDGTNADTTIVSTVFNATTPFASAFTGITAAAALYSVEVADPVDDPGAVPIGPTLPLLAGGFLALGALRQRKAVRRRSGGGK